ncbi:MAG: complex I NDUFA9 subunit family protein [Pseudomonadota bacterium]
MSQPTVCVLGGGGFVGRHLVPLLANQGWRVRVPARRREPVKHLILLPGVEVVETDIHQPGELDRLFQGVQAVINLVGILHETAPAGGEDERSRRGSFQHAHVGLPGQVVGTCRRAAVRRLLHMGALGASETSPSAYQRSKAQGEALVRAAADLEVTVFRPSVIFGPGDSFLSLFARLLPLAPVLPLADGHARFQPVFVGDVARAFATALSRPETVGQAYNLCGPRVYSLAELLGLTARELGLKRLILPLGPGPSYWFARLMELKPGRKLMTRDNHYAMQADNVCPDGFPAVFGRPTPLEAVIGYLREVHPRRHYDPFRRRAGR